MKRTIAALLITVSAISLQGQNAWDALRYSRIYYNGTSRFNGVGASSGAVGADLSLLSTNPAGIGLYKSFEATFSPGTIINHSSSTYNGGEGTDNQAAFAISNGGFVYTMFTGKPKTDAGLRNINFGFAINRQNDFNTSSFITGPNDYSSIANEFAGEINGTGVPANQIRNTWPFGAGLAYDVGLIYFDSTNNLYRSDMPYGGVYQEKSVITNGSMNEYDVSMGGNVANKVYFGITMGISSVRYSEDNAYYEYDSGDSIPYFQSMVYQYGYTTHGTGINVKAGVIYRPANWIRIGVAAHSPTWYSNMHDSYSAAMMAYYDSAITAIPQYSPIGYYDYRLKTPFRAIGSLAFFFGQRGFISGEYEYVNYSWARFNSSDGSFTGTNQDISNNFRAPVIFRLGTEWRFGPVRVRGGFGYNGDPVKSGGAGTRYSASGGAGFFTKHFFVDLAYQWAGIKSDYYMYSSDLNYPAQLNNQSHTVTTTFGVRF